MSRHLIFGDKCRLMLNGYRSGYYAYLLSSYVQARHMHTQLKLGITYKIQSITVKGARVKNV